MVFMLECSLRKENSLQGLLETHSFLFYLRWTSLCKCLTPCLQPKSTYLYKIELKHMPMDTRVPVQNVLWRQSDNSFTMTVLQTWALSQHLWLSMTLLNR